MLRGDPGGAASRTEQLIGALIPPATRRRPASPAPLLLPHFRYLGCRSEKVRGRSAWTCYIKADLHAVATALAAMTGESHPLALSPEALGFPT